MWSKLKLRYACFCFCWLNLKCLNSKENSQHIHTHTLSVWQRAWNKLWLVSISSQSSCQQVVGRITSGRPYNTLSHTPSARRLLQHTHTHTQPWLATVSNQRKKPSVWWLKLQCKTFYAKEDVIYRLWALEIVSRKLAVCKHITNHHEQRAESDIIPANLNLLTVWPSSSFI